MTLLAIPALLMSLSIAILSLNTSLFGPLKGTSQAWPLVLLTSGSLLFFGIFVAFLLYRRWSQIEQTMDILQVNLRHYS